MDAPDVACDMAADFDDAFGSDSDEPAPKKEEPAAAEAEPEQVQEAPKQ